MGGGENIWKCNVTYRCTKVQNKKRFTVNEEKKKIMDKEKKTVISNIKKVWKTKHVIIYKQTEKTKNILPTALK